MNTTCQLRFVDENTDKVAQIGRDTQGDPENIIPDLNHFKKLIQTADTEYGASYTAAQFVFIDKLRDLEETSRSVDDAAPLPLSLSEIVELASWRNHSITPSYFLNHRVANPSDGIEGDERFIYQITLPELQYMDWRVKIAAHDAFPGESSGDTTRAFEVADWRFEGMLEDALAEVRSDD